MTRPWTWGLLILAGVGVAGCHVISPEHLKQRPVDANDQVEATPVSRAVSPANDPAGEADYLGLASDCIVQGKDSEAAVHLSKHLRTYPDQLVFRNQLAELLFKLERHTEAQYHFERFDETASSNGKPLLEQRIHCHTRLMEIAQLRDDPFAEKLNRGIGLYLIGCEVQRKAEDPNELDPDAERLWCRAAKELNGARELREIDARSAWYLYLVWKKLDQPRPAEKALRMAANQVTFSPLPAGEDREMRLALRAADQQTFILTRNSK